MRYLLMLVLTFNCFAEFKIMVIGEDEKKDGREFLVENELDINKTIINMSKKIKGYKSKWGLIEEGSIASRLRTELEGNEVTEYLVPINYTIEIEDITEQIATEKVKSDRKEELREKLKTEDLSPIEINELLRL